MTRPPSLPATLADVERQAAELLDPGVYDYYAGGAGDETTLAANVAAWRGLAVRPRVLVDVSRREPAVTVLGRRLPHPLIVAPMAYHRLATPDGEAATARACAATGTTMCLSTLGTTGVRELAGLVPAAGRWYQLYVFRDRGLARSLVHDAAESGYQAIVVTVDLPVLGRRERDIRNSFVVGAATGVPNAEAAGGTGRLSPADMAALVDPSLRWQDLAELAAATDLPVLVKGILTPEDARRALEHGAAGVVVSNHGGRQLDGVLATADALPAVVDEVGGDADVLVDGGIRRGVDVLRALALGAKAVLVGRPVLWGLAVGGDAGAQRVLELLLAELDNALALAGAPSAAQLDRNWLQRSGG